MNGMVVPFSKVVIGAGDPHWDVGAGNLTQVCKEQEVLLTSLLPGSWNF